MRSLVVALLALALLALTASAGSNPKSQLFLFGDSRYSVASYAALTSAFASVSNNKLNSIVAGSVASAAALESALSADLPSANVNQNSDLVFLAAHGDSCAALEALATSGTAVSRVDGYIFLGCYPSSLGTSTPRLVLVGELDGVNTVDNIVSLNAQQAALSPAESRRRGVFVLSGVTNAQFADGVRVIPSDVNPIFAAESASASQTIAEFVVDFAGPNFLAPQRGRGALFDSLKATTAHIANAFSNALAYDQASACVDFQKTILNVLPGVLPELTYQNTYFAVSNDFVLSKSNASSTGLVEVTSHIFPAELSATSRTKDLLGCKGRRREFFRDRVYGNSTDALFGAATDGRDVHADQITRARNLMLDSQLSRFSGSGRFISFAVDKVYFQGNQWVSNVDSAIVFNASNPNQIILQVPTLRPGWPTSFAAPSCAAILGVPFLPPSLVAQVCNEVFLGNHYGKFIGVKGALLLQSVTAFR